MDEKENRASYFFTFVQTCESIRVTPSKTKKVDLYPVFSLLNEDSLYILVLFL